MSLYNYMLPNININLLRMRTHSKTRRVHLEDSSRWICGKQSGTVTNLPWSALVLHHQLYPPYTFIDAKEFQSLTAWLKKDAQMKTFPTAESVISVNFRYAIRWHVVDKG